MPAQTSLYDALSLDIHVLSIVLQRNHHQHHRCIYHRRLCMLLQSIRKTSLDSIGSWIDELSTDARRKQDEWTVNQLSSGVETASHKLRVFVCISIPQLQSRIMHAAKAILPELTRGHFVPMLTIALACLGRIRSILMQIGRECLTCLQKNKVQIEGSTDHLFEISHDELVAKMNELVNDLRWRDAVCKFGLSKSFLDGEKGRGMNRIDSVAEKADLESMATGGASTNDDIGEVVVTGSAIAGFGDKGEVYEHKGLLSKQIVEDLSWSAEKNVKSEQTNNDSTSDEQPKKKKRKKKKKKSISSAADDSCVNEQQQGVAISAGSEGEPDKNRGNGNTNDISLFDESADSPNQTNTPDSKQEGVRKSEKSRKKKRSKDIDAIFDDNFDNKQYDSGSINAAIEDSSKRKKKKSKKKKGSVIDDIFG